MPLFRKQSAAEQTSLAPHDSKARLLSGRDSQGFMAKPCTPHLHCAARAVLRAAIWQCRGKGAVTLAFSWGIKRGPFSHEREWPPFSAPLHGAGIEARYRAAFYDVQQNCTGSVASLSHSSSSPLRYGEIAAKTILTDLAEDAGEKAVSEQRAEQLLKEETAAYEAYFSGEEAFYTTEQLEEAMQKVMDAYAGGIGTNYRYNEKQLKIAEQKIRQLSELTATLQAKDMDDLLHIYELKERLVVCESVIAHLKARKETRWQGFSQNMDYPKKSEEWDKYVNSVRRNGKIEILLKDLGEVADLRKGETDHEHSDQAE